MRQRGAKLGLQAILLLILISVPSSPRAEVRGFVGGLDDHGTSYLTVCNRGKIAIDVFVAKKAWPHNGWDIESTHLTIGACERVYEWAGASDADGPPAYIGFGFVDSHGQFGAGKIARLPDLGSVKHVVIKARVKGASGNQAPWGEVKDERHDVLTKGDKKFCVRREATLYRTEGELETNCATLQVGNNDLGQYVSMTSALYFRPITTTCPTWLGRGGRVMVDDGHCYGGDYFLTVAAVTNDREMAAVAGNSDDKTEIAPGVAAQDASKALAEYAWKKRQQQLDAADRASAAEQAATKQRTADAAAKGDEFSKMKLAIIARSEEEQRQRWSLPPQSPASNDPQWMGKSKVIKGTVSRVEVDTRKIPQWVTIFFKESPDATFVVCSPSPGIFRERVGQDLSVLIGKTLEVAGNVEHSMCAGKAASIRVVASYGWRIHY